MCECVETASDIAYYLRRFGRGNRGEVASFEYLGEGASKITYATCEHHVMKLELSGKWEGSKHSQTKAEILFWINADAECSKLLAPIYAYDEENFEWILAQRCEVRGGWSEDSDKLCADAEAYGIDDLGGRNIGRTPEGKMVVVDYGINSDSRGDSTYSPCPCTACRHNRGDYSSSLPSMEAVANIIS